MLFWQYLWLAFREKGVFMDFFNIISISVMSLFASVNNVFGSSNFLQSGTVINDVTNSDNLNIVIIGMVVLVIILIGGVIFSKK